MIISGGGITKKLRLLLAVTVVLSMLLGCSAERNVSSGSRKIEIMVMTLYGSDDGGAKIYENACKTFEAESGNIVKHKGDISNEEWKARVITDFEAGSEPDVLFFFTGADSDKLIEGDRVVSIDEIRKSYPGYASNMRDDMLAKSPVDGKKYAVPVHGIWEGLYVNRNVLRACGVSVPGSNYTWDEFLDDCETIKEKGYTPIAAAIQDIPHYWFEFATYNNGNAENHGKLPVHADDEIAKIWAAGLNDIKSLYDLGYFPQNTMAASDAEIRNLILNGKAAFMVDGSWRVGFFEENASDRLGDFAITYVPGKDERRATDIIAGLSMGYYITRKAWDNPEKQVACVDFVNFMTSDSVVNTFSEAAATITALKDDVLLSSDANPLRKDASAMTRGRTGVAIPVQDELTTAARAYLFANVKKVVDGSMSPEEAIAGCIEINDKERSHV